MSRSSLIATGICAVSIIFFACSTNANGPSEDTTKTSVTNVAKPTTTETAKPAPKVKAPAPKPAPTVEAGKPATDTKPKQAFAEAPYKIRFVSKPAAAGKETATTIEITPLDGYKMNKDFPSSLKIDASKAATTPKVKFGVGDANVTEERIGFTVGFTPKGSGALALSGTTDFSVCNERTCKLFRGEKLAWEVSVK